MSKAMQSKTELMRILPFLVNKNKYRSVSRQQAYKKFIKRMFKAEIARRQEQRQEFVKKQREERGRQHSFYNVPDDVLNFWEGSHLKD